MENCNQLAIRVLAVYFHSNDKKLTSAGTNDKIDGLQSPFTKKKKKEDRLHSGEGKIPHEVLKVDQRSTEWAKLAWLQIGDLKRETENFIVAARNLCIRTNLVKLKTDYVIMSKIKPEYTSFS